MQYRALDVFLGPDKQRVGLLFQYGSGPTATTRLIPDERFWRDDHAPVLSQSGLVTDPARRAAFVAEHARQPFFNGMGEKLPVFFHNLLPEGPLRQHLEQIGKLDKGDDFGLLSLCGTDLPGAVYVEPAPLDHISVASVVTQHNDALEPTVTPLPLPAATSLSGVQPKLSLVEKKGRYVARTKDSRGVHIIAKLPTVEFPLLPQVEELSMRLAAKAGVNVAMVQLIPLEHIQAEQPFVLGDGRMFLAVQRFDRTPTQHVHCEDFAQILGVPPEQKYTHPHAHYANLFNVMMSMPELGIDAALEMLRRIVVNDLLGNFDGHLKNFGLLYKDGRTPELSPAYDVVAYAAYFKGKGHGLRFGTSSPKQARLTPMVVRQLCKDVPGLQEPKVNAVIRETVRLAYDNWPQMIQASTLLDEQKARLMAYFESTPAVASLIKRARATASKDEGEVS